MSLYNTRRFLHLIAAFAFLFALFLALMNIYWFSKEAIIESFEFSFAFTGIQAAYNDQFFVSRMLRREGWEWHFWVGSVMTVALIGIAIISAISKDMMSKQLKLFSYLVLVIGLLMFTTGFPLWVRAYTDVSIEIQEFVRPIHYWSAWVFTAILATHALYYVFKLDILRDKRRAK